MTEIYSTALQALDLVPHKKPQQIPEGIHDPQVVAYKALKLAAAISESDTEAGHLLADRTLCKLLLHLGYPDIVEAYSVVTKQY